MPEDSDVLPEYISFSAEAKPEPVNIMFVKHNSFSHPFSSKWVVFSIKPTV